MAKRFLLWWRSTNKLALISVIIASTTIMLIIILGYSLNWGWTGFREHIGPTASQYQPAKTLWDWFQLLIIPAVLAISGYVFTYTTSKNEQNATAKRTEAEREAATKRDETEREIASDNQRETALQQYIDKMSELLLDKKLRESQPDNEMRNVARVRTLTVLPRLDKSRKRSLIRFLYESHLIKNEEPIIVLDGADLSEAALSGAILIEAALSGAALSGANIRVANLSFANLIGSNLNFANLSFSILIGTNLNFANLGEADLRGTDLRRADLRGANLRGADLSKADLSEANLSEANLSEADLRRANLSGANLSGADLREATITQEQLQKAKSLRRATLPDGTTYKETLQTN